MRAFAAAAFVLCTLAAAAWGQAGGPSTPSAGAGVPPSASSVSDTPSSTADAPAAAGPPEGGASSTATGAPSDSLSSILQAFQSANLEEKLSMLQSAKSKPSVSMGPLYQEAIDYLTSNLSTLHSQPSAQTLAVVASQLIGSTGYTKAAESTWQLFQLSVDLSVRLAAADALAIVAKGDAAVINKMNHWLAGQNLLHSTGGTVDPRVIDGCVRALASIADPSSFGILFATMQAGYGEPTTNDAKNAIHLLKGNRAEQLLQVVESGSPSLRSAAFEMAMGENKLSVSQKARIATAVLEVTLASSTTEPSGSSGNAGLRIAAVTYLGKQQWTPAAALIMKNFDRTASEYQAGAVSAGAVVTSIEALAAMSTHEAAVRLSLYLGLINSRTEKGRQFDRQITLAVVQGLGRLGDGVAYDNLSAMQYLDYPQSVKDAATQAVSNLTTS